MGNPHEGGANVLQKGTLELAFETLYQLWKGVLCFLLQHAAIQHAAIHHPVKSNQTLITFHITQ